MKTLLLVVAIAFVPGLALAYPPAPAHEIYGIVRDELGRPLTAAEGIVIMTGHGVEITRATTDPSIGPGINYKLSVPMDSGTLPGLYQQSALQPLMDFTLKVVIGGVSYVPIQMVGSLKQIGSPGGRTRLDLTLGVDSDGDGLPDAWEQALIDSDVTGRLHTLADVTPDGDLDGDGLSNMAEYLLGTYPLAATDGLKLEVIAVADGKAHVRFVSVVGRTYGIKSSADQVTWTGTAFALSPTGGAAEFYQASDTTYVDAYINVGAAQSMQFKLYVQ